eukprot:CAMPEP_0114274752 /NCGR_PEP_ID=MMETSP0058-20121206/29953_1 /TAXON_ID=36894 /ORGANISM="Pyramimonas parkeae, CCMP726" /LENGTH=63 /DNA_ID=CAMNT_0001394605 /DNA_START=190 /DNA_END=378 /DNA_ORIENTATION=-
MTSARVGVIPLGELPTPLVSAFLGHVVHLAQAPRLGPLAATRLLARLPLRALVVERCKFVRLA